MPVMLFRLRGVQEDEAEELRQALDHNGIEFYETPADRWGVSMPAIWLTDESQLDKAQTVVEQCQQQRSARFRQEYEALKKAGRLETFYSRFKNKPLMVLLYILLLVFVLYFFTMPFIYFAQ
jgi:hypothetical protein